MFILWFRSKCGATAIEYAMIGGFISVAIATAVFAIGGDLKGVFQTLNGWLTGGG